MPAPGVRRHSSARPGLRPELSDVRLYHAASPLRVECASPIPNSCVEAVTPSITVCGWRCGLWKGVGCTRGHEAGAPWYHEQRHGEFAGSLSLRVGGQREGGRLEARKRAPIRTPHAGTRSRLPASRAAESQLLFELPCGVSRACEHGDVGRTVRRCPRGKERAPGRI